LSQQPGKKHSQNIGNIVHSALQSGDLSRLKDLGPAISDAVQDAVQPIAGAGAPQDGAAQTPPPPPPPQPDYHYNYGPNSSRPAWQGRAPQGQPGQGQTPANRPAGLPGKSAGLAPLALGVVGMVVFGIGAVLSAVLSFVPWVGGTFLGLGIGFAVCFAACAGVTAAGAGTRKLARRLGQYYALLQEKSVYTFDDLAEKVGREAADIKRDIKRGLKKHLLPDVRMDYAETCVIRGGEAWQLYLETEASRKTREAEESARERRMADPTLAPIENFKSEGAATIKKIRAANDAIDGEAISEKLERLENITARIFSYVEAHPQKLPDTRKFLNYYLPTTLKLVEKYQQYDQMDPQPANILQAKQDIENTLDTIDTAFNNLLESLYQDDTLDVSTDITVLEKMLEQEGLTGKKFDIDQG